MEKQVSDQSKYPYLTGSFSHAMMPSSEAMETTMLDTDEKSMEEKRKQAMAQRRRAEKIESWIWLVASTLAIWVLWTKWQPQSDWTIAIRWIVLLSPFYYIVYYVNRLVKVYMITDDERW